MFGLRRKKATVAPVRPKPAPREPAAEASPDIAALARGVDVALDEFEVAAHAYLAEAGRLDRAGRSAGSHAGARAKIGQCVENRLARLTPVRRDHRKRANGEYIDDLYLPAPTIITLTDGHS